MITVCFLLRTGASLIRSIRLLLGVALARYAPKAAGNSTRSPLFRTLGGRGRKQLTEGRMARQEARRMIVRRAVQAGIITSIGCHTFRATGITVYPLNCGLLEYAQQIAARESARTTKLYDRRNDQVTLDQVESSFSDQNLSCGTAGISARAKLGALLDRMVAGPLGNNENKCNDKNENDERSTER